MKHDRTKLTVVDLFAGAGGLSCGFQQTGCFEVILAVEKERNYRATYKANHKHVRVHHDILDLLDDESLAKLTKEVRAKYGGIDVVIGGPPCQGFSNANRQRNHLISTNNMLVTAFVRFVDAVQPRAFVMENVAMMPSYNFYESWDPVDQEMLATSQVPLTPEQPLLGKVGEYASIMARFLQEHLRAGGVAEAPKCGPLVQEIYPIMKTLSNYIKRGRMDKITRFIHLKRPSLARIHQKLSDQSSGLPVHLHVHLLQLLAMLSLSNAPSGSGIQSQLVLVTEQLGTLAKLNEVADTRIKVEDFSHRSDDGSVFAHLRSYNLADHLERYFMRKDYQVKREVLEAAHFGVPQKRRRVFFIGVKESERSEEVQFPEPLTREGPYTVEDAIRDLATYAPSYEVNQGSLEVPTDVPERPPLAVLLHGRTGRVYNHVQTKTTDTALKRYAALKPGQNFHDLPGELTDSYSEPERTQRNIYRRLTYTEPALTVTNVRKAMWVHPEVDRAISVREAARLQAFPDSYEFRGRKNDQYQQVGNAVPPLLARAVGEVVATMLGKIPVRTLREDLRLHPPLLQPSGSQPNVTRE